MTRLALYVVCIIFGKLDDTCSLSSSGSVRLRNSQVPSRQKKTVVRYRLAEDLNDKLSRRDFFSWKIPVGAAGTYIYGRLVYNALSVQDVKYPEAHELRLEDVISKAFTSSAMQSKSKTFRVLEVGIGRNCRLIRRGLYDTAIQNLPLSSEIRSIELAGLDFRLPSESILVQTKEKLAELENNSHIAIMFQNIEGSITEKSTLPWENGYFDCIICSLTLCSVDDVDKAILEMKRLLRPSGGTIGYLEHVAVNDNELDDHRFLELQQRLLDPLQQLLVDNCHLHRYNDQALLEGLGVEIGNARIIQRERFFVQNMWPVSCQCSGVIQMM